MGVVPPLDGFNAELRRITAAHGALLILDEVMTGFRVSRSGWYGLDPVDADLFTFGKVMGGGLPAAAFGGRADLMEQLAPAGPVYQAGTLSGNPVAVAAGLTTLRLCTDEVYARCDEVAAVLRGAASAALFARRRAAPGAAGRQRCSRSSSCPTSGRCATTTTPARQDDAPHTAFFHAMLARGVYLPPSAFEAWFVNAALDDEALERVLEALPAAAAAAAPGRRPATDAGAAVSGRREPERTTRPPAAARRGLQPRPASSTAGCPASGCPRPVRRWRRPPPTGSPAATSPTWSPARWSAPSRPPRRSPRRSACRSPSTSG